MRRQHRWVGPAALLLSLSGSECLAQAPASFSDVPDHYRIEVGGFRLGSNTTLRLNGSAGNGTEVDFEEALAVPETATRVYVEGYWRIGRRHQLSLGWFRNHREGPGKTLTRDIQWGDRVFTVGTEVHGEAGASYYSGVYRFAAYRNDRFEVGPAAGFGYLSLDAAIRTTDFDGSASMGHVTGDLGAYLSWWAARRLLLRGDARYIIVKPENAEASITDARASALYHPWPKVGAGLQYQYTNFRYDRDILSREIGGSLRYSGFQLMASFAF